MSLPTTQKNKIEYFGFLLSNIFILLISWLQMDAHTQKDINSKCVFQAYQNQLFERSTENKNNDILV